MKAAVTLIVLVVACAWALGQESVGPFKEVTSGTVIGTIDEVRFGSGNTSHGQDSPQKFVRVRVTFEQPKPGDSHVISDVALVAKSGKSYRLVAVRGPSDLADNAVVWTRIDDVCKYQLLVGVIARNAQNQCVGWGLDDKARVVVTEKAKILLGRWEGEAELRMLFEIPRNEEPERLQLKIGGRNGSILLSGPEPTIKNCAYIDSFRYIGDGPLGRFPNPTRSPGDGKRLLSVTASIRGPIKTWDQLTIRTKDGASYPLVALSFDDGGQYILSNAIGRLLLSSGDSDALREVMLVFELPASAIPSVLVAGKASIAFTQ